MKLIELISNIFDTVKDRLKNPLIGTFMFMWIALNWEAILILFYGEMNIIERIEIMNNKYLNFYSTVLYPIILALVYMLLTPYLLNLIDYLIKWSKQNRNKIRFGLKNFILDSEIEIVEKEIKLQKQRSDFENKHDILEQNKRLTDEKSNLEARVDILQQQINKLENSKIEDYYETVFKQFMESNLKDYIEKIVESIYNDTPIESNIPKLIISEFKNQKLIETISINSSEVNSLTDKGIYIWNKYNQVLKEKGLNTHIPSMSK